MSANRQGPPHAPCEQVPMDCSPIGSPSRPCHGDLFKPKTDNGWLSTTLSGFFPAYTSDRRRGITPAAVETLHHAGQEPQVPRRALG